MMETNSRHMELKDGLAEILRKYEDLSPLEILAVASQIVGMLIAHQDQRKVTPALAMRIVGANIEIGNEMALSPLANPMGRG